MAAKRGKAGGAAPSEPDAPKTQPRDYIVCREYTVADLLKAQGDDGESVLDKLADDVTVLVELGHASARTPKEARREIAKGKLEEAELAPEGGGVALNAIPARALTSGRGVVKMRNEPKWDD